MTAIANDGIVRVPAGYKLVSVRNGRYVHLAGVPTHAPNLLEPETVCGKDVWGYYYKPTHPGSPCAKCFAKAGR